MMPALATEIAATGKAILQQAQDQVSELAPELSVNAVRVAGPRIGELVGASQHARLLVVGRETRTAVERMLGGGTTAAVATHAQVPVAVVPQDWQPPADQHAPVVVGLKSTAHSDELLGAAFEVASECGAPIVVMSAWKLPDEYSYRIQEQTHSEYWGALESGMAEEALAPWRRAYPDVPVTVDIAHGDPARALLAVAEEARLVVLLRRPTRKLLGPHLGGTARAVIRGATCPVEIVPAREAVIDAPGLDLEESGAMLR